MTQTSAQPIRCYFNPETQELQVFGRHPGKPWRVLPKTVGIIWHECDQSQNQIDFGSRHYRWNYKIDPAKEVEFLREQYLDQIIEMF